MDLTFLALSFITLAGAVAAMSLRNLVHCALCLVATFAGLAALYLRLGAEFVGFAQILVYVGAVAIVIVFAILLTRNLDSARGEAMVSSSWIVGIGIAVLVLGGLAFAAINSFVVQQPLPSKPPLTVRMIGERLMTHYVIPLEVAGLLLTAALIGAVIIALKEPAPPK